MKVLHIGEYARGGVATHINQLLAYQAKIPEITGLNLLLAARSAGEKFVLVPEHIYYYDFCRRLSQVLPAIVRIRKWILKLQPDIVHIHSSYAGFLARVACFLCLKRPKIIYCAHGWSFNMEVHPLKKRILAYIEKILSLNTSLIINISRYEHDSAAQNKLPMKKMIMVYNGVRERTEVAEPALSLDNDCINLLFAGRFDRPKGLDILLRVFAGYQLKKIKLFLLGESVLGDLELNIPSDVVNLGWVYEDEIDSYYSLFDAVIMPSRWEGFGLTAIEAMRNGKAVIASNRGSLPEIVINGVNGYLFDLGDEQGLVELLRGLDKKTLQEMGRQGYRIYKEHFTGQRMNEAILQAYRKLIWQSYSNSNPKD
ncbi:MAG: glycosyltransferase [Syntrophomonas sp.]